MAVDYKNKLNTKCPTVEQNVGNLSGGNQQKVLLAKWMLADPDILILDEILGILDEGIISLEELKALICQARQSEAELIMTGTVYPQELD